MGRIITGSLFGILYLYKNYSILQRYLRHIPLFRKIISNEAHFTEKVKKRMILKKSGCSKDYFLLRDKILLFTSIMTPSDPRGSDAVLTFTYRHHTSTFLPIVNCQRERISQRI